MEGDARNVANAIIVHHILRSENPERFHSRKRGYVCGIYII